MKRLADYQIILEQAAFDRKEVIIATKERGTVSGLFTGVDEYDTDPERLGFWIQTDEHEEDTVFLDEIIGIEVVQQPISA